jgi:hypothetical protein
MGRRLRASLAPLLALVVSASFDFEALLHAHRDGAQDLRGRAWARVESTAPCGQAPHWDRARADHQPACAACLVSASPLERGGFGALAEPAVRGALDGPRRGGPPPSATQVARRPGRAPPRFLAPA